MAFLTDTHRAPALNGIVALFGAIKADFADFRAYRKTVAKLSILSNRQLDDLGISRSEINASAKEAVYGY